MTIREFTESSRTFRTFAVISASILAICFIGLLGANLQEQNQVNQLINDNHQAVAQQLASQRTQLANSQQQLTQTKELVVEQEAYVECLFSLATETPYSSTPQLPTCQAPNVSFSDSGSNSNTPATTTPSQSSGSTTQPSQVASNPSPTPIPAPKPISHPLICALTLDLLGC